MIFCLKMYFRFILALVVAGALVAPSNAHDLLYRSVRPKVQEDLPETIPIFKKIPAFKRSHALHLPSIKSSNSHESRCSKTEQDCHLSGGQLGCCPFQNGTCCSDKLTCCPSGHHCNIKEGTCVKEIESKVNSVVCPDGQSQCPDGATCCKLQSGDWGCCPLEKATCCSDGIHCCPHGYKCDVSSGTCTKGDLTHVFLKTKTKAKAQSVVCPDGQSQCPDGATCCKLQSGDWGCCPLEKATCCSDGIHCCPHGYKCDVSSGTCTKGNALALGTKLSSCCTFLSGSVLCCKNGLVCDPTNYQCGPPKSEVSQTATSEALVLTDETMPPMPNHVSMFQALRRFVSCGVNYKCGSKSTCCLSYSGSPRCCAHSNGVCCPGGSQCCPGGFTCTASGKCSLRKFP